MSPILRLIAQNCIFVCAKLIALTDISGSVCLLIFCVAINKLHSWLTLVFLMTIANEKISFEVKFIQYKFFFFTCIVRQGEMGKPII